MTIKKLRHGAALFGLTLLLFSLLCIINVEATTNNTTLAHKTTIAFEFTNVPGATFERMWHSGLTWPELGLPDGEILHARGWDHYGIVSGGLVGTLTYPGDVNLNMITRDGTSWGIICFSVSYGDLSGTFEGRMVVKFNGGYITGIFVCHGDGDFEGMHLKGTCEGSMDVGDYSAIATILNPHG